MTASNGKHPSSKLLNGAGASIFRVRSGVPMPHGNEVYPFRRMKVGQSFLLPKETRAPAVRCAAAQFCKKNPGARFSVVRTGPDQYGCWRVK